jgi:hypothetical protein
MYVIDYLNLPPLPAKWRREGEILSGAKEGGEFMKPR